MAEHLSAYLAYLNPKKEKASRGNFINNETDSGSSVDILKTNLRSVSPTDETVAINNNNDPEKRRQSSDLKNITASKRLSDSVLKTSLVTTLSPTTTNLCTDEIDDLLEIVGGGLNKAPSKDSGFDQSSSNVLFNSSTSSNSEHLHDIALDESGIAADNSTIETPIKEKLVQSYQQSPLLPMSPETDSNDISMNETPPVERTFENGEIMNPKSPFSLNFEGRDNLSMVQMVCRELLETERSYVNDLKEVIEGYIDHMKKNYPNDDIEIFDIFGNLEEIYTFNKGVLHQIEECEAEINEIDPIKLANVFCEQTSGFNKHYTQYCTEYPEAASTLTYILRDSLVANYFLERQSAIGHALSLESYLLKPVQRILKYNLLLKDILKKFSGDEDGRVIINTALVAMSDVAEYINEMKRLHENARQVDDILESIIDMDEPVNRYETGKFVLENTFKVNGVRGDRTIILFEKMLILGKKTENNQLQFKDRLECSNMMMLASMPKEPLGFQLLRFDNQKETYTIVAKTAEIKAEWTQHLKRLILENHTVKIPQTARQAILGEEKVKSKYNSLPMETLDNTGMNTLRKQIPKGAKSPNVRDRDSVTMATGIKKESNEKDSSKEPKRHLRPKDFLKDEKKNRSNVTSPTGLTAEKEKKEKFRLIRRHKHKPSLDSNLIIENTNEEDNTNGFPPPDILLKSRSLESLKDSIKLQDDIEYKEEESGDIPTSPEPEEISTPSIRHRIRSNTNGPPLCHHKKGVGGGTPEPGRGRPFAEKCNSISESPSPDLLVDAEGTLDQPKADLSVDESSSKNRKMSEDNNPHSPIKNLVNRVSSALQNSFNIHSSSSSSSSSNSNNAPSSPTPMFFNPTQNWSSSTKSSPKKTIENREEVESPLPVDEPNFSSTQNETDTNENINDKNTDKTTIYPSPAEVESMVTPSSNELLPPKPDKGDVSDTEDITWTNNVDALFYEVNADIDSIAGSISDTAKSNDSESDVNNTPTDSSTSLGMEMKETSTEGDDLGEQGEEVEGIDQVKQVADRIKEYKRLVDAEKRRHSWTQREPKNITEMIESLDSIQMEDNVLSPTYSSLRRRFRPSRDYGSQGRDVRSSLEICNEMPRVASPTQIKSLDHYVIDTPFVELDAKSGELLSSRTTPTSSRMLSESDENVHASSTSSDTTLHGSISEAAEDGHVLAKRSSLDNVFYTEENGGSGELSKSAKSMSLPVALNKKEKVERKMSDTTNKTPTKGDGEIDLSAYSDLLKEEGENVAKRTEVYFRALKNFEQHKKKPVVQKPKTPSFTTSDFSPLISRENITNFDRNDEATISSANTTMSPLLEDVGSIATSKDTVTPTATTKDGDKLKELSAIITENLTKRLEESIKQGIVKNNDETKERYGLDFKTTITYSNITNQEKDNLCEVSSPVGKFPVKCDKNFDSDRDENNNDKSSASDEERTTLALSSDLNNNETNKVFHIGTPIDKTKVFRIAGKEPNTNIENDKKFFHIEKQKVKPYQFNNSSNIEKRQPNENIEKVRLCRISGDDKTLRCRLDIIEKTKVGRQDEKLSCHTSGNEKPSDIDKIRIFQQDSNGKVELNSDGRSSPVVTNRCLSPCDAGMSNLEESATPLGSRRCKSASMLSLTGSQSLSRPPSRLFTTETFINLDKRSLKKSNSTPPESCNIVLPPSSSENENKENKELSTETNNNNNNDNNNNNNNINNSNNNCNNSNNNNKNNIENEERRDSCTSSYKDHKIKIKCKLDTTLQRKTTPDIYTCTLPMTKRVTRSCSMPSVNGIASYDSERREKTRAKREQIKQLKSNLDNCVEESPRGRKSTKNSDDETSPTYQRSTSLPRRKANFLVIPTNEPLEETKKSDKYVLRSPSIRNIQQNHVNNRIKDYFINLQKSSVISRSRPNLLLVDNNSCSGSDSEENSCEENENENENVENAEIAENENNVQICRGTVRSMIKKYGQVNFVFD